MGVVFVTDLPSESQAVVAVSGPKTMNTQTNGITNKFQFVSFQRALRRIDT